MGRMPNERELESRKRKAEAEADDTVWRSCGLVDGSDEDDEDASPQYVSLCGLSDGAPPAPAPDLKEEQEEEEEAPPAPASARVQGVKARAELQGMLDALESSHKMPTGPELAAALRMCR